MFFVKSAFLLWNDIASRGVLSLKIQISIEEYIPRSIQGGQAAAPIS